MSIKTPCDLLLTGQYLLTQAHDTVIADAAVAVASGRVLAAGPRGALVAVHAPAKVLDLGDCVLMPGLVNAHTHASMTLLRGVADDLPLDQWLTRYIFPREKLLDQELIGLGAELACAEMTRFGVTAFADMYLAEDAVFAAAEASGLRILGGEGIFTFASPGYASHDDLFALVRDQAARWKDHPRVRVAVMPHSVYTTTPELLARCRDLADELGLSIHLHLAETVRESEDCVKAHGRRPVAYCDSLGLIGERTTIAHGVVLTEEELDLLARRGAKVAHCPRSNMKLASGTAPVPAMLERGIPVGLGSDGAASSNNLNIFQEMTAAALLHKVTANDPTAVAARTALAMATTGGAACLHWPGLGTIAPGGPADIIAVDIRSSHMRPVHSPTSSLVYAATGLEVRMTMVGGEILYQDGVFSRFDLDGLLARVREAAIRLH